MPANDDAAREALAHLRAALYGANPKVWSAPGRPLLGVADTIRERLDEPTPR